MIFTQVIISALCVQPFFILIQEIQVYRQHQDNYCLSHGPLWACAVVMLVQGRI